MPTLDPVSLPAIAFSEPLVGALVAVLGITLVSRLFLRVYRRRHPGFAKVAILDLLAAGICLGVGLVVLEHGVWQLTVMLAPGLVAVWVYDILRLRRAERAAELTLDVHEWPAETKPQPQPRATGATVGVGSAAVAFALTSVVAAELRPVDETEAIVAAASRDLPARVDDISRIVAVSATDEALVYRYEIADAAAADLMRTLSPRELKFAIGQGVAQRGEDACTSIAQINRRYRIRYDYVDSRAAPVNSFAYRRGECSA